MQKLCQQLKWGIVEARGVEVIGANGHESLIRGKLASSKSYASGGAVAKPFVWAEPLN